jgi:hypothetical protein
MCLNIIANR